MRLRTKPIKDIRIPEAFGDLLVLLEPMVEFCPIMEQFEHKGPRNFVYHGGRGSAKSHSIATVLVIAGARRPLRILCAREIQKSLATSSKQLIEDKIHEYGLGEFYKITNTGIEGKNGTKFLFMGLRSNPDAVKSTEGLDIAWLEEANYVSQASLDNLTPTLRKPGSCLIASFNPRHETDPIYDRFLGGEPPKRSIVRQVNWKDNPWFPIELIEELEWMKERDYDKYMHVWEGQILQRNDAKVFPEFTIDDLDDQIPEGQHPRFGADWGFSVDPTVLVKVYRWGRTLYIREEAYKVRCEIDETPALFAGDDLRSNSEEMSEGLTWTNEHNHEGLEGAYRNTIVADSARPETISYMQQRGFKIEKSIKGAGSVEDGVEFIRSHNIVVHPSCTHAIDELNTYSYKVDKLTDKVLSVLADKNNHVIDSIRYALEADRRALRMLGLGGVGREGIVSAGRVVDLQTSVED